ncbi:MAG TPA: glycosyltransferase [Phycisphaerae bacterium]|nr:glycosyltransferase [Phycisphaerae bacterium]
MAEPAVSVIIPTHNRATLLVAALDSVAGQTFRDFEVIVVDDGSTEPIEEAVGGHVVRPKVLRQPNLGPAAARNRGIYAARGDLVAFLDSDDLWLPTKLERFLGALEKDPGCPLFFGPMSAIDAAGAAVPGRTKPCFGGNITERLFCSSFIHVPTVVCRKKLLIDARGFDEALPVCEDYDLWLRLSVDHAFGLIDEPLALRRLHGNRLSKSKMSRNLNVKASVLKRFYGWDKAQVKISREKAMTRLSKVCFAAGRAALLNGEYHLAADHLRESRRFGRSATKLFPWKAAAACMGIFSREASAKPAAIVQN